MRNVVLSYSLNDKEDHFISILSSMIQEEGFIPISNDMFQKRNGGREYFYNLIKSSHLFIGIISEDSTDKNNVIDEYNIALEGKIPALLLIDDKININMDITSQPTIVKFNRKNPEEAIEYIQERIKASRQMKKINDKALAWLLGGYASTNLIKMFSREGES